jgi:hypothetical protein
MKTTASTNAFSLDKAATKRIPDPAGLEITCTSGSIWITLEGILHDVILTAGTSDDTFVTRSHRSALIYALSESEIVISAPAVTAVHTQYGQAQMHCEQPMPMLHA